MQKQYIPIYSVMGIGHSNSLENLLTIEKGISDTTLILTPSNNKHTKNNDMKSLKNTKGLSETVIVRLTDKTMALKEPKVKQWSTKHS